MRVSSVIFCLLVVMAGSVRADTWRVPVDAPTIQAGLDLAATDDTVLVAAGVYLEHDLRITSGLVLRGETGLPEDVVLDAQLQGRLLEVMAVSDTVRVEGLTLRNGLATGVGDLSRGGAAFLEQTPVRFRDCRFHDNMAAGGGGALYIDECPRVELIDCDLSGNSAYAPGSAGPGGAIAMYVLASEGSLVAVRCRLDGNLSGGPGGAIYVDDGNLYLTDSEVTDSRSGLEAWPAGAGVFVRRANASPSGSEAPDLEVQIIGCRIAGNVGNVVEVPYAGDGGGVLIKGYDADNLFDVLVTDTVFENNYNAQGAGLYVGRYAQGLIVRCRFLHNRAYLNGGGAVKGGRWPANLGENARFEYCEFLGNEAGYDENGLVSPELGWGGAFYTRYYPRADFVNCSFADNRAGGVSPRGDAIYHYSEQRNFTDLLQLIRISNSVFYGENGVDVQMRADPGGFGRVAYSALEAGEYIGLGATPDHAVYLTESPFREPANLRLHGTSSCIDQARLVGPGPDLDGTVVPVGGGTDIGAYEWVAVSGVDEGTPPVPIRSLTASPNPFNPRTTISFDLARAGRVRLECFDPAGRRVRSLLDVDLPPGQHRVPWDGKDGGGRSLASGVYFLRLTTPAGMETGRVLLIK